MPRSLLTSDDLHAFGANVRDTLVASRILVAATTATHVQCDQCHDGHVEEVSRVSTPGGGIRFLMNCPEAGLVEVAPERLRQWKIDVDRLACLLAGRVGDGRMPELLIRDTAWRLGEITVAGAAFNVVFLIRPAAVGEPLLLPISTPPERTVLVVTSDGGMGLDGFAGVLSLASAFRFDGTGLDFALDRIRASLRVASDGAQNSFRLLGQVWELTFAGEKVLIRDSRGLAYIARLLAAPQRDVPAVSLLAACAGIDPHIATGSKGEVLDDQARREYQQRYSDLLEDLTEAEANNDSGKIERLQAEMDQLASELANATGLGGRSRPNTDAEKVRKSVSMAVTRAIESIRAEHESLGNHLSAFISMGLVFRYAPAPSIEWLT